MVDHFLEAFLPQFSSCHGPLAFGLVCWIAAEDGDDCGWQVLLQTEFSTISNDPKIDPFRGFPNAGETTAQTAYRRAYQESSGVLAIDPSLLDDSDECFYDNIFHCILELPEETSLADLFAAYAHNQATESLERDASAQLAIVKWRDHIRWHRTRPNFLHVEARSS